MRKICTFLMAFIIWSPAFAAEPLSKPDDSPKDIFTYIEPEIARLVIIKHFSNISSDYLPEFKSDKSDRDILVDVLNEYNKMLQTNDGHVSDTGLKNICRVAFASLKPASNQAFDAKSNTLAKIKLEAIKCVDFVKALTHMQLEMETECQYNIDKHNDSQSRIRYINKVDGTGFIRKDGSLPWRLFNPGALRDSQYKCTRIKTTPNGIFAAFDSEARGRVALRWLLENKDVYKGKTIRQAMPIYAPPKENNTAHYIKVLASQGVNVDKVLSNLDENEWGKLLDAISQMEGWNNQGEIEYLR